jgi:hypothetical protein
MKLESAEFIFRDREEIWNVYFVQNDKGKPLFVKIISGREREGKPRTVPNEDGRYKPCMTHAAELIRQAASKPTRNNCEKQRRKKAAKPKKPSFFVVSNMGQ